MSEPIQHIKWNVALWGYILRFCDTWCHMSFIHDNYQIKANISATLIVTFSETPPNIYSSWYLYFPAHWRNTWDTVLIGTVKPVCKDHLYNKICYLWFIQYCVWLKTKGSNLLLLTISAFWGSSRWPLATYMSSRRQRSIPLGGRYRQVSLYIVMVDQYLYCMLKG